MFTINLGGGSSVQNLFLGFQHTLHFGPRLGRVYRALEIRFMYSARVAGKYGRGGTVTASQTTSPPPGGLEYRYTGLGSELLAHGIAFGGGWYLPLPPYPPPARVIQ